MIYKVKEKFYSGKPTVAIVNHPANDVGGHEDSHVVEKSIGDGIMELQTVSNNPNYGSADLEVIRGDLWPGVIFHNSQGYVEEQDRQEEQLYSLVWNGEKSTELLVPIKERLESGMVSDSTLWRIAEILQCIPGRERQNFQF